MDNYGYSCNDKQEEILNKKINIAETLIGIYTEIKEIEYNIIDDDEELNKKIELAETLEELHIEINEIVDIGSNNEDDLKENLINNKLKLLDKKEELNNKLDDVTRDINAINIKLQLL